MSAAQSDPVRLIPALKKSYGENLLGHCRAKHVEAARATRCRPQHLCLFAE